MSTPSPDTKGPVAANPLQLHSDVLASIVERVGTSTLAVLGRRHVDGSAAAAAVASAVVWRPGLVVTAAHVFRRMPAAASLVGHEGRNVAAALVGIDSSTDMALFRIADEATAGALPAITTGDAYAVKPGHFAIAVGRSAEGDAIASAGLVNRAAGPWQTWLGGHIDRLIRLDGGIYEGLSGGAVADAAGAVIGIATAALSRSYGIVVPNSTVDRVVDALLAQGHVARPWLGIGAQPVTLPPGAGVAAGQTGLLVTSLASGGPAERAGVRVGDIFVTAASAPVGTLHAMRQALASHVGQSAMLSLLRSGAATALPVQVGEWPGARRC